MTTSRRFEILANRDINKETYVTPWPEAGLIVTDSPYDPAPSLRIENGRVVEMDGKAAAEFDVLDSFIATYGLDLDVAEEAMVTPSSHIARMLVLDLC
jgi:propanediol dehydratase large subunit